MFTYKESLTNFTMVLWPEVITDNREIIYCHFLMTPVNRVFQNMAMLVPSSMVFNSFFQPSPCFPDIRGWTLWACYSVNQIVFMFLFRFIFNTKEWSFLWFVGYFCDGLIFVNILNGFADFFANVFSFWTSIREDNFSFGWLLFIFV